MEISALRVALERRVPRFSVPRRRADAGPHSLADAAARQRKHRRLRHARRGDGDARSPARPPSSPASELRERNVTNLADALQDVMGLDTGMGSDNGPRQPNVGIWGLKEFDALLFMVDGVPVGGPFNPSLAQIDINDIDHIEIVKGPQGTLYGVSAFAGMVQVFTKSGDGRAPTVALAGGSFNEGRVAASTDDSRSASATFRVFGNFDRADGWQDRTDYKDDRGGFRFDMPIGDGGVRLRRLQHVPEHAALRLAAAGRSADRRGDPGLQDRQQLRADRRPPRPPRLRPDGDRRRSRSSRRRRSRTPSA